MNEFFQRQHRFLHRTLTLPSRLLLLAATAAMVAAIFLPLWQISLVAPQYQEGLRIDIYAHKLVGGNHGQDITEINYLNHYIGMKTIAQEDFVEMKVLPFAFGFFALMTLRAAAIGRIISLIDLVALVAYFGVYSIGNFYYRLYTYGHSLDPHAAVKIEPFTPVLIGKQQIANFVQTSLPLSGAVVLTLFPLLVLAAIWFSRREAK